MLDKRARAGDGIKDLVGSGRLARGRIRTCSARRRSPASVENQIENVRVHGIPVVVAVDKFPGVTNGASAAQ